jgi:thymidylate synthase (FAD)
MAFVLPKTYMVGHTTIDPNELKRYLEDTNNLDFLASVEAARRDGLTDGEILTSFFAKLCYASLSDGKNLNLTRTRDIPDNLRATLKAGHGSVFEHAWINFVTTNCSRVLTHELVRHRVGTAFSQTSGRYVRSDRLDVVSDPILAQRGVLHDAEAESLRSTLESFMRRMGDRIAAMDCDFTLKKKLTRARPTR